MSTIWGGQRINMGRYGNEGEQWLQEYHRNNIGKDGHYLGGSTGII